MRILFIAMADSVHTARWISQIDNLGWDIHLFPSKDYGVVHPDLKNITIYHSFYGRQKNCDRTVRFRGIPVFSEVIAAIGRRTLKEIFPNYRVLQLKHLIKRLKPDIIHSIEIQAAGYLTLDVRRQYGDRFPSWVVTNFGSDIYLFGRLPEHVEKIKAVLKPMG